MDLTNRERRTLIICALLVAATLAAYWPVTGCAFLNYDDNVFVTQNPRVAGGVNWASLAWAFSTGLGGNWQPVTWLSHLLDVQLFGLNPAWHHFTSLLIHTVSAVLLYLLLQRSTGAAWRSAAVAALFALHPLHVESVAWVAERKDVLSGFFFMLTLWAYVCYAERNSESRNPKTEGSPNPEIQRTESSLTGTHHASRITQFFPIFHLRSPIFYLLSLLFFTLGLMSKPMLVTVPFVLLLLDYWPLRRLVSGTTDHGLRTTDHGPQGEGGTTHDQSRITPHGPVSMRQSQIVNRKFHPLLPLLLEKIPFIVLSAASSVVAFLAQRASESVYPLAVLPLTDRAINALVAYAVYLQKTLWPVGLAVFYPLPQRLPVTAGIVAGVVVLGVTAWAVVPLLAGIRSTASQKHLLGSGTQCSPWRVVGWFWYLGMLLPVIGLVQVGLQARADRYTYLPLIGVFILVVWEVAEACRWGRVRSSKPEVRSTEGSECPDSEISSPRRSVAWLLVCGAAAAVVILACALRTRDQVRYWRNSESLFRQAAAVTKDNWLSHYNLAGALCEDGRFDEAATEYRQTLAIHPDYARAHVNLGNLLLREGKADEAIGHWQQALQIRPGDASTHNNLATALLGRGQVDEAIAQLRQALASDPGLAIAHSSLGNTLLRKGKLDEATAHLQEAVRLRPDLARAQCSLGGALLRKGRAIEALEHYHAAVAVQPATAPVLTAVAWVFATCPEAGVRNGIRAVELAEQAERMAGDANPAILATLAAAYAEAGRFPEAVAAAQRVLGQISAQGNTPQAQALRAQIALYQAGSPFRDPGLSP